MHTSARREEIAQILRQTQTPISASSLAKQFSISRQVIVGDIALLRVGGMNIISTPRGYIMQTHIKTFKNFEKQIACMHTQEKMEEEINTIIDCGGALLDVTVEHAVYGELTAPLHLYSRYDTQLFLEKMQEPCAKALCSLTAGVHLHRICCPDESVYNRIVKALTQKGLLFYTE